jgi:hypothetical protein
LQDWHEAWATECLRVLKPGGHLLAFGGTRTSHRLVCAIEDAGFEIRDSLVWLYGSGFPKSLNVGKAIDKAAGAERAVIGQRQSRGRHAGSGADVEQRLAGRVPRHRGDARRSTPRPPPPRPSAGRAGAPRSSPRTNRSCWRASR